MVDVGSIETIRDPVARIRAATEAIAAMQTDLADLGRIRRDAITELRQRGLSFAEIGQAVGLTRGRVHQIQANDPER